MSSAPGTDFVTDRLRLRRFRDEDADFAFDLHRNPDLARFVPSAALADRAGAGAWIARIREIEGSTRGWWLVGLHDGTPVAAVVLKAIRPSAGRATDEVEIGWRQHADRTGHGYVTEAARAVLAAGLAGGLPRVIAVVDPENVASQRVCERLGMRHQGRTDAYYDQTVELFEARGA